MMAVVATANAQAQRRRFAPSAVAPCWAAVPTHGFIFLNMGASSRSATSVSCAACARNQYSDNRQFPHLRHLHRTTESTGALDRGYECCTDRNACPLGPQGDYPAVFADQKVGWQFASVFALPCRQYSQNVYFGPLKLGRLLERHMRIEDAYGRLKRHR